MLDHMHALHPWIFLRRGRIDGENLRVRHVGVHKIGVEHTGKLHVRRIARLPGGFRQAVLAFDGLPTYFRSLFIGDTGGSLAGTLRASSRQCITGNADRHLHRFLHGHSGLGGHRSSIGFSS